MKNSGFNFIFALVLFSNSSLLGQKGPGNNQIQLGIFYGKVVEEETNSPIGYASVQIWSVDPSDSLGVSKNKKLLGGQLTDERGEFNLSDIPMNTPVSIKISYLGYKSFEKKIIPVQKTSPNRMEAQKLMKDLGNIKLKLSENELNQVTVTGNVSQLNLSIDKKVYKVDKNAVSTGGTAEDALRNMPTVNVDIDGNVSLRNATPEIFVDGRPTTLTIDQIPADDIEQVELITNPSSKFDAASGGSAGIINIVMKKDRRKGLNGSVRLGMDSNLGGNLGGDLNYREGSINSFISANFNRRVSIGIGETERKTINTNPYLNIFQNSAPGNIGHSGVVRLGFDWFINNRNTFTVSANAHNLYFNPTDEVKSKTDTILNNSIIGTFNSIRNSDVIRNPKPFGTQLLYKYLFPQEGKELTADVSLNRTIFEGSGDYQTKFIEDQTIVKQVQDIESRTKYAIFQTDFVTPLGKNDKLELGGRASIREYKSENNISNVNLVTGAYEPVYQFANKYSFDDLVVGIYSTLLKSYTKWGFQAGIRIESSKYNGTIIGSDSSFSNEYPFAVFPSLYLNYKLNQQDQIQLNFTRKINRPGFFQLLPFEDFTDSLLLIRGNPALLPEFVNNCEFSYQNIFTNGSNLLLSIYGRYVTDLITRYQYLEYIPSVSKEVIVQSYENANSSFSYGFEGNYRNTIFKILELNTNLNLYNAIVDGTNIEGFLKQNQFTWLIKENANFRFKKQWSLQITGEYQSRAAFLNDGGGGGGGPFSFSSSGRGGGSQPGGPGRGDLNSTAQGYNKPFFSVDLALKKDFWKKSASLTLGVQDIFRSRKRGSYSESQFFVQEGWRLRDPQLVRLNFSYRFGKTDASIFKRRNEKSGSDGLDTI